MPHKRVHDSTEAAKGPLKKRENDMASKNKRAFSVENEKVRDILDKELAPPCTSMARTPLPTWTTLNSEVVEGVKAIKTACSHNCYDTCGVIAYVKGGKLLKVEGDPDHPVTRGTLCVKTYTYPRRVHSDERIKYPMMRTGQRGEGKFKRITWDEAFDHICKKLTAVREKYGSEALVEYLYSGNREFLGKNISGRFLNLFGASKLVGSF
ncbi:MAG: molybdopterin-dependent oxidoreductase [Thermodesulfovibrionales bacterium]